ncbi:hypothetical protein M8J75_016400 [Diaphorina citri]|nr:hypothetical protein M8J75_016400 [Diaphorina citri]
MMHQPNIINMIGQPRIINADATTPKDPTPMMLQHPMIINTADTTPKDHQHINTDELIHQPKIISISTHDKPARMREIFRSVVLLS